MQKTLLIIFAILLGTCSKPPTLLEEIKRQGELRVAIRVSPTTYYIGSQGPEGPEYDLAKGFASFLRVDLKLIEVEHFSDVIPAVQTGRAHMAASGITITPEREQQVNFGPSYQKVSQQLVYRRGTYRPRKIEDLAGRQLEIPGNTSYADTLKSIQRDNPDFVWVENPTAETQDLLIDVAQGKIDFTVADSTIVSIHQNFLPEIRVAKDLGTEDSLAWAFQKRNDKSLLDEAERYIAYIRENGELKRIEERYYGHAAEFDYVGTRTFKRHIDRRLSKYEDYFREAGDSTEIDWRLLAAMSYQESHWNPSAVSHTGVRGLMMLTRRTAEVVNVDDRTDPKQSIQGGAAYMKYLHERISPEVQEPDRTWLALAAYNVGYGHLQDAQDIVRRQRGDPNSWLDVKQALPKLAERKYHKNSNYGYARGWEPVKYVENIRTYYRILQWLSEDETPESEAPESEETIARSFDQKVRLQTTAS